MSKLILAIFGYLLFLILLVAMHDSSRNKKISRYCFHAVENQDTLVLCFSGTEQPEIHRTPEGWTVIKMGCSNVYETQNSFKVFQTTTE